MFVITCIITSMARNSLLCADVPLRNYSLTLICGWAAGPPPPPPLAGTCPPWGWGGGWCGGCCIAGCCGATGIGTGGCGPGNGAGGCGFYNWKQQFNAFSIPKHQNITGPKINPNPNRNWECEHCEACSQTALCRHHDCCFLRHSW